MKPAPLSELPLAVPTGDELKALWISPALGAFIHRRLEQLMSWGHTPASDLAQPVDQLVRHARDRLTSFLEITGHGRMNLPAEHRAMLIRKIEIAGALLLAAHDRIRAEVPDEVSTQPEGENHGS